MVTSVDSNLGLLFKIQRNFANPRELQVNWTLLRSFFWFTVKKFFWFADSLYGGELIPPDYPKKIFVELMNTATKSVEFSFNNNLYKQIDGVVMGSPLSVALANIFVRYHESKLFESNQATPLPPICG